MLFDSHAHLNFQIFKDGLVEILKQMKALPAGAINVGAQLETSREAVKLASENDNLYAAIGLHPIHVFDEVYKAENYEALINDKTVAIGEIGLDFWHLKYLKQPYRIVLVHGWGGNSNENFFVWLDEKLTALGHQVLRFDLPNSDFPKQDKWLAEITKQVGYVNDKTLFIGFSMGGVATLKFLERLEEGTKIGGVFLLGAPMKDPGYPEVADFFTTTLNWEKIKTTGDKFFVYSSTNDDIVSPDQGKEMAQNLNCELKVVPNAWHFALTEAPFLLDDILSTIKSLTDNLQSVEAVIAKQKEVFIAQLTLAKKHDLAVIVHGREGLDGKSAYSDILEILKQQNITRAVFHCYGGTIDTAKKILEHGFYLGFDGPITFKNNNEILLEVLKATPLDRILLETDAPYLSPEPKRGKQNEPLNVQHVAVKAAEIKGVTPAEMIEANWQNVKKLFKI